MANRMPSLLALLGLAAAAGFQNRDKLKDMVGQFMDRPQDQTAGAQAQPERSLQQGLSELVQRFTQGGQGDTAQSWVNTGQNMAVSPDQLRNVLGDGVITDLAQKTGMTQTDLLARLAQALPDTVDQLTPDGAIAMTEPPQRAVR